MAAANGNLSKSQVWSLVTLQGGQIRWLLPYPAHYIGTEEAGHDVATVAWQTKGSTTTTAVTADLLCHGALHQSKIGHVPKYEYLKGVQNMMADDDATSRLWKLTDEKLLTYFNLQYPQTRSWQLQHLQPPVHSELVLLLCHTKLQPESLKKDPKPNSNICHDPTHLPL
jgi:hypothetical protein